MNPRTVIGCVCIALVLFVGAQALFAAPPPGVGWATHAGGTEEDFGYGVSALSDGSSIVTGMFFGTATFGSTTLTNAESYDVFTAKVSADGTWAWATKAGGTGEDSGTAISALSDGSSIVTGSFEGIATFGSTTLTSAGNDDVFIAKMNADGTWAWAIRAGGGGDDLGYGVSALPDGSSIVTGYFRGTAFFGNTLFASLLGSPDVFIAKVNADGTWAWARKSGGTGLDTGRALSAVPDGDGSSIVTGSFEGTPSFGSIRLGNAGYTDVFTGRLNAGGTWVWVTTAGGGSNDQGNAISALPDGSSIVTGSFSGTATFGGTPLTSAGNDDVFTARLNADGTWAWATKAGGAGYDYGRGISTLPDGSSIVTGSFSGTATFGSTTLISAGNDDVFTAKMNADGTWAWATKAGGGGGDQGFGISALPDGSYIATGNFRDTAAFGSTTVTSGANSQCSPGVELVESCADVFVARYVDAPEPPAAPTADAGDASVTVTLTPLAVGLVTSYTVISSPGGQTCTVVAPLTSCIVGGLTNGTSYTFTATATNGGGTSESSSPSSSVIPMTAAAAPTSLVATAHDQSIDIAFTAGSDGGSPISNYKYRLGGTGAWIAFAPAQTTSPVTVSGLTNGTAYTIELLAITDYVSPGAESTVTASVTPQPPAPNTPAQPTAAAGDAQATVTVAPGAGVGGTPTSYLVTTVEDNSKTCTVVAPLTSCTVSGLTNGTSYTFTATATNAGGTGPASEGSGAVTPAAAPGPALDPAPGPVPDPTPALAPALAPITAFEASPTLAPLGAPIAGATKVAVTGKVQCVATACVTTGAVPRGATRITQRATSRPAGHSAAGTCTVRRISTKRAYSCTVHLSRGTWVITTTARTQSSAMAHFSKRVQVAPRKAAVTG